MKSPNKLWCGGGSGGGGEGEGSESFFKMCGKCVRGVEAVCSKYNNLVGNQVGIVLVPFEVT
jgi:hypothetical protein